MRGRGYLKDLEGLGEIAIRANPATGAIRMRAVFDNRDRQFTPGLFAKLRLGGGTATGAVLTPERAIGTDQTKRYVFVVGLDKTAAGQPLDVTLGRIADQQLRVVLWAALACKVVGLPSAASDRRPRGGTPAPSRPGDRQGAVDGQ